MFLRKTPRKKTDRSGARGDARKRYAGAVSGGTAERASVAFGEATPYQALAGGPRGCPGQTTGRGRRTLCVCRERRSRQQGTRDAQTATEVAVEAASRAGRDGNPARGNADEAGRGTGPRSHRMAPGRYRDGQGKFHVHLHPQPPEAAPDPPTRRSLPAAH